MRLLLLVLALGEAHAQLSPNSPWPMRGQNPRHTANGLVAAPDNGVAVIKYQAGGPISSSPAVGADGTVYVGSQDSYLHVVNGADDTPTTINDVDDLKGNLTEDKMVVADGVTSLVYLGPLMSESKVTQLESEDEFTDCTGNDVTSATPCFPGPSPASNNPSPDFNPSPNPPWP